MGWDGMGLAEMGIIFRDMLYTTIVLRYAVSARSKGSISSGA
jgi:hypothetical protein